MSHCFNGGSSFMVNCYKGKYSRLRFKILGIVLVLVLTSCVTFKEHVITSNFPIS